MQPMSLEALKPITPEQHFKNACSSIDDPTTQRFMNCLPDIRSGEALQVAAMVVNRNRPEWRTQLLAVVRQFPQENYEQVCFALISRECFKETLDVFQHSPKTCLSYGPLLLSSLTAIAPHCNKPYVNEVTNLMFERIQKISPYELFDLATKMKNQIGTITAIQRIVATKNDRLQPSYMFFEKAVGVNSSEVINLIRNNFNTPKYNLNLVEAICYNDEVDFLEHIQGCLENIPATRKAQKYLNDCLERSVSYENIERVKCLLPYYLPTYQDGYTLMTASETGNKAIFDLLADLTPRPEKILVAMEDQGCDFEELTLLQECVQERAQIKQRNKMLKIIEKRGNPTQRQPHRKM